MTDAVVRDLARAKAAFQLRAIEAVIRCAAIADTHRNGGDSTQIEAPFMSGSGARSAIAQGQAR